MHAAASCKCQGAALLQSLVGSPGCGDAVVPKLKHMAQEIHASCLDIVALQEVTCKKAVAYLCVLLCELHVGFWTYWVSNSLKGNDRFAFLWKQSAVWLKPWSLRRTECSEKQASLLGCGCDVVKRMSEQFAGNAMSDELPEC